MKAISNKTPNMKADFTDKGSPFLWWPRTTWIRDMVRKPESSHLCSLNFTKIPVTRSFENKKSRWQMANCLGFKERFPPKRTVETSTQK